MPLAAVAIPAISSVASGIIGSHAAGSAAKTEAAAGQRAIQNTNVARDAALRTEGDIYGQNREALNPYTTAGSDALRYLSEGTAPGGAFNSSPTASEVMAQDPGYQFALDQGQQALERAEAAGGRTGGGAALKAASRYAHDYATNAYGDAYNRFMGNRQQNYENLARLAGLGLNATGELVNAGERYGGDASNLITGAARENADLTTGIGNANAAGTVGGANAWSSALTNLAKIAAAYPKPPSPAAPGAAPPATGVPPLYQPPIMSPNLNLSGYAS